MFGAMAGVRTDHIPFITPRGAPDDMAYHAFDDYSIYVVDTQVASTDNEDGCFTYSRAHADEYVGKGYCRYISRGDQDKKWVTNPDWHSASWLSTAEYELAIAAYLKDAGFQINTLRLEVPGGQDALSVPDERRYALGSLTEYWAILAVMRCFEAQGLESRLVFWFDN